MTSLHRLFHRRMLAGALCLALTLPVAAANLVVSPTTFEFSAQDLAENKKAQALYLTNISSAPVRVQVRVRSWEQEDDHDMLSETRDLAVSPAMIEIPAGERQLVRVLVPETGRFAANAEQAYRLLINELATESAPPRNHRGLKFQLEYSLPVFVNTPANPQTQVTMQWKNNMLTVDNDGTSRVRLSDVVWRNPDGTRVPVVSGLLGYVLAGQEMEWSVPRPANAVAGGQLLAVFEQNGDEQVVPLDLGD